MQKIDDTKESEASEGSGRRICVALTGNPNSGKTTLFNALTGFNCRVANYPGVTVEKKEGRICLPGFSTAADLIDLPGVYTLFGHSPDEMVAVSVVTGSSDNVDAVVAVVDSTTLERNLFLASQLIDSGVPVVVALSMLDVADAKGLKVYPELLSRKLGVPVIATRARESRGLDLLKQAIALKMKNPDPSPRRRMWAAEGSPFRMSLECLEQKVREDTGCTPICAAITSSGLISGVIAPSTPSLSEAAGKERAELRKLGIEPDTFEAEARYEMLKEVVRHCTAYTAASQGDLTYRLDGILTHRVWGMFVFFGLLALMFQSIFTLAEYPMLALSRMVEVSGGWLSSVMSEGQLRSFLIDGVLAGVGSVLVFVPQIAVLFLFMALLEDTGYMARASFLMDRVMNALGLQGRSFIPLLNSFACTVPGILSARIIPSRQSRIHTILIAPLMSCSARLPVYALLIAAVIPERRVLSYFSVQGLTLLGLYLLGIVTAAMVALVLKWTSGKKEAGYFVMEMPAYHVPSLRSVGKEVWERVRTFLGTAGKMIFLCSVLLWFLASYPHAPEGTGLARRIEYSFVGQAGKMLEPVVKPLGYGWEEAIALLTSFAAREVFVSTLATVYNLQDPAGNVSSLVSILREKNRRGEFSLPTGLSLLVFFVLACQCSSTLFTCRRETGSWGWTGVLFAYTLALAWIGAWLTFRISSVLLS